MSSKTYKLRALVLKKTKLSEKDLIVDLLASDGSLVECVAKGARRPGSSLASRLELYSVLDLLLAKGRSLDIVCEARLVNSRSTIRYNLFLNACCSPITELLDFIAQPELKQPRIFDIANAALDIISNNYDLSSNNDSSSNNDLSCALLSATLWKIVAQIGYRPHFDICIYCGQDIADLPDTRMRSISLLDGGAVCDACLKATELLPVSSVTLDWCKAYLHMKFSELQEIYPSLDTSIDSLQLARKWIQVHMGKKLKSIDFLLQLL